jgi:hypothetical protein
MPAGVRVGARVGDVLCVAFAGGSQELILAGADHGALGRLTVAARRTLITGEQDVVATAVA